MRAVADGGEPGMHERFVVAVLVARAELEVSVEKQPEIVPPAGEHDPLVRRRLREDHLVAVEPLFRVSREPVRVDEAGEQRERHRRDPTADRADRPQLVAEQPRRPARDGGVQDAEQKARAHQAELGGQHDRKQQRRDQRSEVIEREHLGDEVLELEPSP